MAKYLVFVDGAAGTTGLRIHERLAGREDIELLCLPEDTRKDLDERVKAVSQADASILCLPDTASKELVANAPQNAIILDTSTAHRTAPGWVYGFPELGIKRAEIQKAKRISVPGCHASGFLALATPLVEKGILPKGARPVCHSLTGYSGGGKSMIAAYENDMPQSYQSPRLYCLGMAHKHLPEMQAHSGLLAAPLFCPVVDDYYAGMLVSVPLAADSLNGTQTPQSIATALAEYYEGEALVAVHGPGEAPADGTFSAAQLAGHDSMHLHVQGNDEQILLCAVYDNLGKGASGAAVQCLNLVLGCAETSGLVP